MNSNPAGTTSGELAPARWFNSGTPLVTTVTSGSGASMIGSLPNVMGKPMAVRGLPWEMTSAKSCTTPSGCAVTAFTFTRRAETVTV